MAVGDFCTTTKEGAVKPGRRVYAAWVLLMGLVVGGVLPARADKPLIAVLPFAAIDVSASTAQILATLFETNLVNTDAYSVLSQMERQQILAAQEESVSDCTDEACAVEIGKLLAAEQIIMGTVAALGKKLIINAKIIDVQTSKTLAAGNVSAASVEELDVACEKLTLSLVEKAAPGVLAAKPAETTAPEAAPAEAAAAAEAVPAETEAATAEAAKPAVEEPEVVKRPPRVKRERVAPQPVEGLNVPAVVLLSGGVLLTEVGWLAESIGVVAGVQAREAWSAYASATSNLDALYEEYEARQTTYTVGTVGAYGLWGLGPALSATSLFLFPGNPIGISTAGRITYAAGIVSALAGNVLHGIGATYAAQSRESWQDYVEGTSNLDALYELYDDAHSRYLLLSVLSYSLWAAGSAAVPVSFLLPGERTELAPTLPAKIVSAGGMLLAAAGNFAFGLASTAQSTAESAWESYSEATANLDVLYEEYEQASVRYRASVVTAYGLWVAGGAAVAASLFVPWERGAPSTAGAGTGARVVAGIEPRPAGVALWAKVTW